MFSLHKQLAKDTAIVGDLELSKVLLMNDCQYPWVILVPKRDKVKEIFQLEPEDQQRLLWESSHVGKFMYEYYKGDKMNIGALGNVVPQLHVHHVVRYENDRAWPKPVWGAVPVKPYGIGRLNTRVMELRGLFKAMGLTVGTDGYQYDPSQVSSE